MTAESLGRNDLQVLLEEISQDLAARGIRGHMFSVGGAAMALAYSTRRFTRDVDGVFEPKAEIYAAAGRVAARHHLPEDWLNDAVKAILPGADPNTHDMTALPGLRASVGSPPHLFGPEGARGTDRPRRRRHSICPRRRDGLHAREPGWADPDQHRVAVVVLLPQYLQVPAVMADVDAPQWWWRNDGTDATEAGLPRIRRVFDDVQGGIKCRQDRRISGR